MNRRGFISSLVGAAGMPLVPWRGLIESRIFLPSRVALTEAAIERVCLQIIDEAYLTSNTRWYLKAVPLPALMTAHRTREGLQVKSIPRFSVSVYGTAG
jgi:hypothetical protein